MPHILAVAYPDIDGQLRAQQQLQGGAVRWTRARCDHHLCYRTDTLGRFDLGIILYQWLKRILCQSYHQAFGPDWLMGKMTVDFRHQRVWVTLFTPPACNVCRHLWLAVFMLSDIYANSTIKVPIKIKNKNKKNYSWLWLDHSDQDGFHA